VRENDWLRQAARLFGSRHQGVPVGVGDDCAVLSPAGELLISTDTVVAGVHFDLSLMDHRDAGWRALAVALSDLAACGADPQRPVAALVSAQLPADLNDENLLALADGLGQCAQAHSCAIVGGDTVSTPGPLALTLTVLGYAERAVLRRGARPGDLLAVSGPLGSAGAGLFALRAGFAAPEYDDCRRAYRRPQALLAAGHVLARTATAMMDLSDGLLMDLDRLCAASGVGANIELNGLPLTDAAREIFNRLGHDPAVTAATCGDDYQLLVALHPTSLEAMHAELPGLTVVGHIVEGDAVHVLHDGRPVEIARRGYEHGKENETS